MRRGTQAAIEFGAFLFELRTNAAMSMRQVGNKLGAPAATVSQVEKAQRAVKERHIPAWAIALGVEESVLREKWESLQEKYPVGPIARNRTKNAQPDELKTLMSQLTGPQRNRVIGYIEAILEENNA
jgi:transcriptional regulator with XRE-family HTH domain